ncbi:metallophosphoesterase [Bacillus sp. RG28]|uniref:Metallophosphoesterase n=1 Tax=Gottfriedia endophytica TaxID=2820819 RepID=A0A940NDN3_9BACI|nr:metallophosphoesterase [Gottfriedia endophytica]MBP0723594.1 metallophosphoesterase [Gottfriedia endophytica]
MRKKVILPLTIFTVIFIGINLFLGIQGWKYIDSIFSYNPPSFLKPIYWVAFWFFTFSYILSRVFKNALSRNAFRFLHKIGAYWIAVFYYALLLVLAADIVASILKRVTNFSERGITITLGTFVVLLIVIVISKSRWNALNTKISHYDITIHKKNEKYEELFIVLISDLHLSTLVTNNRLDWLVNEVNGLSPDLVLIAGDIIDEDITPFVEEKMTETLKKLRPKLGTFAVPGNHDYYGGHLHHLADHLKEANVNFLLDEFQLVDESFYIIGRKDLASKHRLEVEQILEEIDLTKPLILLDHQPLKLEVPTNLGIDLQVSGHTHRGQFMPNHFITRKIFELDWGYLKKENSHFIVSSGFGTWGPPIRSGNNSEIVTINVKFD